MDRKCGLTACLLVLSMSFFISFALADILQQESVTTKERTISIDIKSKEYGKYIAKDQPGSSYNSAEKTLTFRVNETNREPQWRLVYNPDTLEIIQLSCNAGITSSIYPIFTGTKAECENEAKRLGLIDNREFVDEKECMSIAPVVR